jgi:catalase
MKSPIRKSGTQLALLSLVEFHPFVMADGNAPTNDPILRFGCPPHAVSFVKRLPGL